MLYFDHGYLSKPLSCVCEYIIHLSFLCVHTVSVFGLMVGMWQVLAVVTFPISMLKQVISVIQLVIACKNIGALDAVARARSSN